MTATPRRMSLPPVLVHKEGERIRVPEGGELVCFKNAEGRLGLKVLYSRETMVKLSTSLYCHQRPSEFRQIVEHTPELLGLPHPIPTTTDSSSSDDETPPLPVPPSPLHFYSPLRGPKTPADEKMRLLNIQREHRLEHGGAIPLNLDTPLAKLPRGT